MKYVRTSSGHTPEQIEAVRQRIKEKLRALDERKERFKMFCDVIELDDEPDYPRPITWSELQSMKDLAAYYLIHGSKTEKKLAQRLAHAEAWIRAEAKAQQGSILYTTAIN